MPACSCCRRTSPRGRCACCASGRAWGGCTRAPDSCGARMRRGREAPIPEDVRRALEGLLGAGVGDVRVIEHSWFVRLHGPAVATTRAHRIYLRGSAADFFADPWLMLHEYCHVIRQWQQGTLTTAGYLIELLRRGY